MTMSVFHTKGITFTIGSSSPVTITKLYSTPDMGSDPEQVDVTSFDDTTTKSYIPGLQDVQKLNFDFWNEKTNFVAAASAEPQNGQTVTYTVTYPSGVVYTITGSHQTYVLADSVNEGEKFRISISVSGVTRTLPSVSGTT